jgi:hypothetical protein
LEQSQGESRREAEDACWKDDRFKIYKCIVFILDVGATITISLKKSSSLNGTLLKTNSFSDFSMKN